MNGKVSKLLFGVLFLGSIITFGACDGGQSNGFSEFYGGGGGTSDGNVGSVTLSWEAPKTNEDGTPLTDFAGYRVYYGLVSRIYTNVIDVSNFTSCDIGGLLTGRTYYFTVTASDTSGNESSYSNEVSASITDS